VVDRYIRYESPTPNERGHHTGVFGLANGLARAGVLSDAEHEFCRINNAWYDETLTYPSAGSPEGYDRAINPLAASWFKASAAVFLKRVQGYLAILRADGVACVERRSDDPGVVIYEDAHQVAVLPPTAVDGL
jgi:hypothetical protein